jgi:16S rRNA G966 N2-methylase RsmD
MARRKKSGEPELFVEQSGQLRITDKSAEQQAIEKRRVECLGMTFKSDEERRTHFLEKLREKLKDPEFRKIEGFPIGKDDDILALSDPPYYTACPNPFLADFIRCYGKPYDPNVPYSRTPFAVDVSEGKTDPLYTAHSYHTKVPHKAIMRAILHYTEPGDVVLDGFAGSGMTGVAAQVCERPDPEFRQKIEAEWKQAGFRPPKWGARRAVLSELAPAATFIAANYNIPFDVDAFEKAARQILDEVETELGWMYETLHKDKKTKGRINYMVWSEVFSCPECSKEVVFLEEALDTSTKRVREDFPCPHCGATLTKDNLQRNFETLRDPATGQPWKRIRLRPALINYSVGKQAFEKRPDSKDLALLDRIEKLPLPPEVPTDHFPIECMYHGSRLAPKGFTRVHHLFLPRPAQSLGALWNKARSTGHSRLRGTMLFFVEQAIWGMSVLARYAPTHYSQVNQYLSGVYYVGSQIVDVNPGYILRGKLIRLSKAFRNYPTRMQFGCTATTSSTVSLGVPSESADYVFTDPPFGSNIPYADLNFLIESWHRVKTDAGPEAIVDEPKNKALPQYQELMRRCLAEFYRALKPGRWMTMVFHNSSNAVWNAIQEAMLAAGFIVADVRTLDKQQGSYRQVTSAAMKQDLVISAYKPNCGLEQRFVAVAGTEEGVWDFVRAHLKQLPVFISKDGLAEVIAERQAYVLFDRMVAFHVQRGVTVPLSAAEFNAGLTRRFIPRDGMHFLPEQATEYDKKRMTVKGMAQLELFVVDEATAIQWLRQELAKKPYTLQELTPRFMQEAQRAWAKHEQSVELREILEQNFFRYEGTGPIPMQIVSWLKCSEVFRDRLRKLEAKPGAVNEAGLATNDPAVSAAAADRWYVPDPGREGDLEKFRERALLREFDEYRESKQRQLKVFRLEAIRAGFKRAWQERDYATIIAVARKIPENVLQEDPKLLMWYDQAVTRAGEVS